MRSCRAPASLALLSLLSFASCNEGAPLDSSGSPRQSPVAPLSKTHQEIVSGATAPDDPSVFFLEVTTPSGVATCSATLITPDLLLTAAHCLSAQFGSVECTETRIDEPLSVDSFRVSNEPDLAGSPTPSWSFPEIARVRIVHEGALLCGHDIALIQLSLPLSEEVARPVAVPQGPPFAGVESDASYRAVGYGSVHPSGTGERVRRISLPLDLQCDSPEACTDLVLSGAAGAPNVPAPAIAENEWIGQAAACPGDSGGPALVETDEGQKIIGVLSRGHSDCSLNIYSFPQSAAFRETVRDMIQNTELGPIYEFPSWLIEPEAPETKPDEEAAGGMGGEGGRALDPPAETGGTVSAAGPELGSWETESGCSCRTSGPSQQRTPWGAPAILLISLSFGWARRRSAPARLKEYR